MADVTITNKGGIVSRVLKSDRPNSYTSTYEVAASTTYEPTGSFQNTAFLIETGTNYTLTAENGGDLTAGLVTGQIYPIALNKVVTGLSTVVKLIR